METNAPLSLFVLPLGGIKLELEVPPLSTVRELKQRIEKAASVQPDAQLLSWQEKILEEVELVAGSPRPQSLQECGLSEGVMLHLTDFSDLRPGSGQCHRIAKTEDRGITLQQLERVIGFVRKHCENTHGEPWWYDSFPGSKTYKRALSTRTINLYQIASWIIKPATRPYRSSFVEFLAVDPEAQKPQWYVSHWWGEPATKFVACLKAHGRERDLKDSTSYWVCAYANNQHELGAELVVNPTQTSFYRAMQNCEGAVLVLDDDGTPFRRVWCCFEKVVAVMPNKDRHRPFLLDIATATKDDAVLLTTNLTPREQNAEDEQDGDGWQAKAQREERFPLPLIEKALAIDIEQSEASYELDRRRILNVIAQVGKGKLDGNPPKHHENYDRANRRLRSLFAVAGWRSAVKAGPRMIPDFMEALKTDAGRPSLHLSFARCAGFNNAQMLKVAEGLPQGLKELDLDLRHTDGRIGDQGLKGVAGALGVGLVTLKLNFAGSDKVGDAGIGALAAALKQFQCGDIPAHKRLSCLSLNFTGCNKVGDRGLTELITALPGTLKHLELLFRGCSRISNMSVSVLPAKIRSLQSLKVLILDLNGLVGEDGLAGLSEPIPAASSGHMREMDLRIGTNAAVKEAELPAIAANLSSCFRDDRQDRHPELALRFEGCCGLISDQGLSTLMESMAGRLSQLTLEITSCDALGDTGLANVTQAFHPRLRVVRLSFAQCQRLTDDGVRSIMHALPLGLQRLDFDLSHCPQVTDAAIMELSGHLQEDLKRFRLALARCGKVGDKALQSLAGQLPAGLEWLRLDFRWCKISDTGVEDLIKAIPDWVGNFAFMISGSAGVSADAVKRTASGLRSVREWQRELLGTAGTGNAAYKAARKRKLQELRTERSGDTFLPESEPRALKARRVA